MHRALLVLLLLAGLVDAAPRPRERAILVLNAAGFRGAFGSDWMIAEVTSDAVAATRSALIAARALEKDDVLLLATCAHASTDSFCFDWPLREVDALLAAVPARKVVILECCHSGAALEQLPHADAVLAACGRGEECGGVFIALLFEALGRGERLDAAWTYASDEKRLTDGYARLHAAAPDFWPYAGFVRPLRRGDLPLRLR